MQGDEILRIPLSLDSLQIFSHLSWTHQRNVDPILRNSASDTVHVEIFWCVQEKNSQKKVEKNEKNIGIFF